MILRHTCNEYLVLLAKSGMTVGLQNRPCSGFLDLPMELCLQRTTKANDDYRSQNAQLMKNLESKLPLSLKPHLVLDI
jgi:hypothetical protein